MLLRNSYTNYHTKRATTKHESPFRCSLVRGFASDGAPKEAHAAHDLGGEALAGQAFQRHVTDICHVTQAVRRPLNRPTRSGSPPNHPIR